MSRHNLSTIRRALDQYMEDRGAAPATLDELVQRRYLREIPVDEGFANAASYVDWMFNARMMRQ